jgi:hypothetical protein
MGTFSSVCGMGRIVSAYLSSRQYVVRQGCYLV